MKILFISIFIFTLTPIFAQDIVEWSPEYQIKLEDFKSPQTEINDELGSYSIFSGIQTEFGFNMSTGQFMFTKNFNSKVRTALYKNSAVIIAPDTATAQNLLNFAQYEFDLTELYTRKFRKEIYEQKKGLSNSDFFQQIYQKLQEELNAEISRVMKATDLGSSSELLIEEHRKVLKQIDELSDFCKECKPKKKKKKG